MVFIIGALTAFVKLAIAAGLIGFVACLTFQAVIQWLRDRSALKSSDKSNIAFSLQEKLKAGNYRTVYGIFSKRKNEVLEGQVIDSDSIDNELAMQHRSKDLVCYE